MKSMEELFHAQLQDVYFAEKQLLKGNYSPLCGVVTRV
jgi:ferritin-like metal-binding protein YciE